MNTNYHISDSDLKCPYCDHVQDDVFELNLKFWETESLECQSCEKKFKATMEVCYSTEGDCELNEWEHDMEHTPTSKSQNFYMCNNCEFCERR